MDLHRSTSAPIASGERLFGAMMVLVEALAPTLAFGLPIAAMMVVVMAAAERVLRAGERRGLLRHRRNWTSAAVGNALVELHLAFEPCKATAIERLAGTEERDEGNRVGDGRDDRPGGDVIVIDFVRRRRIDEHHLKTIFDRGRTPGGG